MKKIFALVCVCGMAFLTGCLKDDRNNFMVPDSITLTAADAVQEASVHTGYFILGVAKSGRGQQAAKAWVSSDGAAALLDQYNAAQKEENPDFVPLEALPSNIYTLDGSDISWSASDFVKEVKISWDPEAVAEYIAGKANPVIALTLQSDDMPLDDSERLILVHLSRSNLSLTQTLQDRLIDSRKVEQREDGSWPVLKETLVFDLQMDNAIKYTGMSFPVKIDNTLIDAFNEGRDEPCVAAPEGLFTLLTDSVTIPESGRAATFKGVLDKSVLMVDGKLVEFPTYVIPVRVDVSGMTATRDGKEFDLKGVGFNDMVSYITVTYFKRTGELIINREWGLFSSSAASWNEYYGGTPNTDRNVTLDDHYVYIAETIGTAANLWAIDMEDPTKVKKLPTSTVKHSGTFWLSCPRVLPNSDPEINGGKDVLCVSNMSMDGDGGGNAETDPPTTFLYVYDKGIDKDPTPIGLKTYAGRRLGDTYTFWGTFQDGIFFFKDMNSAQGTVTFPISGRTGDPKTMPANLYLQGRVVAPNVTGAGAYFPFPDNINKGFASTRGGEQSWVVSSATDLKTLKGAATPTLTALSGYYADAAFRCFEYSGKRYVAYTRQVSTSDGRLFILEGELTDSWEDIVAARNIVYQAAIQVDQENQDTYPLCSRYSGNSGMDIDVRLYNYDVFIAVVKQNVGLSLFRMSR